jgi:hypothetical protein
MDDLIVEQMEAEASVDIMSSRNLHRSIIFSTIDSTRWKEETERVAPSLKASMKEKSRGSSGWVSNIGTMKQYSVKANISESSLNDEVDISTISLVEMVSLLQKSILDSLSTIIRGESMVNSHNSLSTLSVEYAGIREVCLNSIKILRMTNSF